MAAGSSVIEAPDITDRALVALKKAIAEGKADSITAIQVIVNPKDKICVEVTAVPVMISYEGDGAYIPDVQTNGSATGEIDEADPQDPYKIEFTVDSNKCDSYVHFGHGVVN